MQGTADNPDPAYAKPAMTSWRASFLYVAELDVRTVSRRLPRVVSSTPRFGIRARYTGSNSNEDVIQRRTVGSVVAGHR